MRGRKYRRRRTESRISLRLVYSMDIHIKKETNRFHRHFNHATGKEYFTARDYVADVKKMGLEPYREVSKPAPKKYEGVSDEARRMMASVTYTDGKPNVGDRYIDALKQMGMKPMPNDLRNKQRGGWR